MPNTIPGTIAAKVMSGCRFNAIIDEAQRRFVVKLCFLSADEVHAVTESIEAGIRNGCVADITAMLCSVDPVLANFWLVWRDTVASEAWAAVLKSIFLCGQGEVA